MALSNAAPSVVSRQLVGVCRCGEMMYLKEDLLTYCSGCQTLAAGCRCQTGRWSRTVDSSLR